MRNMLATPRMLLTIFTAAPLPVGPQCTIRLPSNASTGCAAARSCGAPPARMVSVPCAADTRPPLTGASSTRMPAVAPMAATSRTVAGSTELISSSRGARAGSTLGSRPSSPRTTARTCASVATITITTAALAQSATRCVTWMPSDRSGASASARRSQTVNWTPLRARRSAIGPPMPPAPIRATVGRAVAVDDCMVGSSLSVSWIAAAPGGRCAQLRGASTVGTIAALAGDPNKRGHA